MGKSVYSSTLLVQASNIRQKMFPKQNNSCKRVSKNSHDVDDHSAVLYKITYGMMNSN